VYGRAVQQNRETLGCSSPTSYCGRKEEEANRAPSSALRAMLQRLRGAIGVSVAWALAWAATQMVVLGGAVLLAGVTVPLGGIVSIAISGAAAGFVSGLVFSTVFSIVNRDRTLAELRVGPSTLLGAMAGALFPVAFVVLATTAGAPLSGVVAAATILMGGGLGGVTSFGLVRVATSAPAGLGATKGAHLIDPE